MFYLDGCHDYSIILLFFLMSHCVESIGYILALLHMCRLIAPCPKCWGYWSYISGFLGLPDWVLFLILS